MSQKFGAFSPVLVAAGDVTASRSIKEYAVVAVPCQQ
jgi:hypothetical protein